MSKGDPQHGNGFIKNVYESNEFALTPLWQLLSELILNKEGKNCLVMTREKLLANVNYM